METTECKLEGYFVYEGKIQVKKRISYAHDMRDIWLPRIDLKVFQNKFTSRIGDISDLKLRGTILWILCQKWVLPTLWRLNSRESFYQGK